MNDAVRAALAVVVEGGALSREEAREAMGAIMDGLATPAQLASLLVALRMRTETVEELTGFATAMRERVVPVVAPPGTIDTCGTGGDARGTFNISTTAALVVAAAGVPVAKHGNRAITSASGSSDMLDALGVTVHQTALEAEEGLREDGFTFLFAPEFHPAMRHAGPIRREIGIRTAFNLLGPITNPAGARRQLVGVADRVSAERLAGVLQALGVERAFVVTAERLDELALDGSGVLYDVRPEGILERPVLPAQVDLAAASTDELLGGTPAENAAVAEAILDGAPGPRRDVVLLNAGAALEVAGVVESLARGVQLAGETIDSGAARELLGRLRARRRERERVRPPEGAEQRRMGHTTNEVPV